MGAESDLRKFSEAQNLYVAGLLPQSEDIFRELFSSPTQAGRARAAVGIIRLQNGNSAEAYNWFVDSLKQGNNAEAHYGLGVIDETNGKRAEAINRFRRAVALDPSHEGALNRLRALDDAGSRPGNPPGTRSDRWTTAAQSPPAPPVQENFEPSAPDVGALYVILRQDNSPLSRQTLSLLQTLDRDCRARFTAFLAPWFAVALVPLVLVALRLGIKMMHLRF
jgi:tetratricopeptide (TPR) repeat protein